jgi:hypothetical protein
VVGSCERLNERLGFIIYGQFFECQNDRLLLKRAPAPWRQRILLNAEVPVECDSNMR